MIIYCAGPIRGDVTYQKFFTKVIDYIESQGHTVLSEFSTKFSSTIPLTDKQTYKRDLKWLKSNALTLDEIRKLPKGSGKQRLVFAPAKYVSDDDCRENKVDFSQLPFEIYRLEK